MGKYKETVRLIRELKDKIARVSDIEGYSVTKVDRIKRQLAEAEILLTEMKREAREVLAEAGEQIK